MIYIAKRLNAPNGAFIGIVLGALHAAYFEDLYTNYLRALPGGGKSMALWRNDGTLLSRSPTETDAAADVTPPDLAPADDQRRPAHVLDGKPAWQHGRHRATSPRQPAADR